MGRRRERWQRQVAVYLGDDETVEAVFPAIRGREKKGGFDSIVVVTSKQITLFDSGHGQLRDVVRTYPRAIRLGSPRGILWLCPLLDVKVNWTYFREVRAADRALDARQER
jgi:hypothetical protein